MREQDSEPKVQKWREDFRTRYPRTNNEGGDEETPGKYCVGLVMQHRRYNYRCAIFGWDTHCVAERVRRTKLKYFICRKYFIRRNIRRTID